MGRVKGSSPPMALRTPYAMPAAVSYGALLSYDAVSGTESGYAAMDLLRAVRCATAARRRPQTRPRRLPYLPTISLRHVQY
eukprot:2277511-Rhodomonas_salina.1